MSLDLLFEPSDAAPVFEPASPAPRPSGRRTPHRRRRATAATEPSRRPIGARLAGSFPHEDRAEHRSGHGREGARARGPRGDARGGGQDALVRRVGRPRRGVRRDVGRLRGRAREAQGRPHGEGVRQGARVHAHRLLHPDRGGPRGVGLPRHGRVLRRQRARPGRRDGPVRRRDAGGHGRPRQHHHGGARPGVRPDSAARAPRHGRPVQGLRGDDAGRRLVRRRRHQRPLRPVLGLRPPPCRRRDARPRLLLRQGARPRAPRRPRRVHHRLGNAR